MSSEPHFIAAPNEYKLLNPPLDGITAAKFSADRTSRLLVVSSWDSCVRVYDVVANSLRVSYTHGGPVLDCDFQEGTRCISGGLDQVVKAFDLNSNQEISVGQHAAAVRCIEFNPEVNVAISGSWDHTIKLWDLRAPTGIGSFQQPDKVYTMSCCGHRLIVGTAGRKVILWDLRNMGIPEQRRDSSLKYQTRCIRSFPNRQGYVLSSIEGRVAVEYIDPHPEIQKKKYAFKCHRLKEDGTGTELIYPVNAVAFHPIHNTFATGGSDGYVNLWDPFNKKRLCQFHKYPSSISSLSFSKDGALLAISSSYMYEQNEDITAAEDTIFIRKVSDQETKPKT